MLQKIFIILASMTGSFVLTRWIEPASGPLDGIHPHFVNTIIIVLLALTLVIGVYGYRQFSDKKRTHSKKLAKAFEIMGKGGFRTIDGDLKFHVPYPYKEYQAYERRLTPAEILALLNDPKDMSTIHRFDWVELEESDEADFANAREHLESYKKIKALSNREKKAVVEFEKFCEKYDVKTMIQRPELQIMSRPLKLEFDKICENLTNATREFRAHLEILFQQLEDGSIIKGKCKLGY